MFLCQLFLLFHSIHRICIGKKPLSLYWDPFLQSLNQNQRYGLVGRVFEDSLGVFRQKHNTKMAGCHDLNLGFSKKLK